LSFAVFLLIILIILLLFDLYFIISFRNFIRRNNYNKVYYKILIILSVIGIILIAVRFTDRSYNPNLPNLTWLSFAYISLWYLPKLIIIPFFFIKDLFLTIIRLIRKRKNDFLRLNKKLNKRLQIFGWILVLIPFLIVAKTEFFTSQKFIVKEVNITSSDSNFKDLKIVHISDIHAGSLRNSSKMIEVAEIINKNLPDFIFISGDFVNNDPNEMQNISEGIKKLKSKYGIYGILGNHDHYMTDEELEKLKHFIKNTGVDLLINENRKIKVNNTTVNIVGIDDLSFGNNYGDVDKALNGIDTSFYSIMLAHNPRNWKEYNFINRGINLTLSGHSHGGQVMFDLKFIKIIPGEMAYDENMGLYKEKGKYIYVNPGLGTTGPPIRIGIPPEITIINIK